VQLTTKEPEVFTDLQGDAAALSSLGVAHGDMVYLLYHFERDVRPAYQRSEFEKRPFGALKSEKLPRITLLIAVFGVTK